MERIFDLYSAGLERLREWAAEQLSARRRARGRVGALDQGQGARRDAGAAARRVAQPRRRLRLAARPTSSSLMRLLASPLPEAREFGERGAARAAQGDPGVREARRHARPRRRLDRVPARSCASARRRRRRASASTTRARARSRPSVQLLRADGIRGGPDRRVPVRGDRRAGGGAARGGRARWSPTERARLIADLAGPAGEPPAQARPRLRGAALPLRDRLRLRRLPRPPAPPHADLPVAAARLRAGRRRARGGRGRRLRRRLSRGPRGEPRRARPAARRRAWSRRRPTRCRSRTGSGTCST